MKSPSPSALRAYNSWDAIKLVALVLMFIDHAGLFFFPDDDWLRAIGRAAAPVFLFLAGYSSHYRFRWDLLLLAIVMTTSGISVSGHVHALNILFTILMSRALFEWLEKRGRHITRPYEWYVGCVALFSSMVVFQYGTFGLLFAICGYMKSHPQYYPRAQTKRFMLLVFITYGCMCAYFNYDNLFDRLIMIASLTGAFVMLWNFKLYDISAPAWFARPAKSLARYSGYIYAFHIIALEWITGIAY